MSCTTLTDKETYKALESEMDPRANPCLCYRTLGWKPQDLMPTSRAPPMARVPRTARVMSTWVSMCRAVRSNVRSTAAGTPARKYIIAVLTCTSHGHHFRCPLIFGLNARSLRTSLLQELMHLRMLSDTEDLKSAVESLPKTRPLLRAFLGPGIRNCSAAWCDQQHFETRSSSKELESKRAS